MAEGRQPACPPHSRGPSGRPVGSGPGPDVHPARGRPGDLVAVSTRLGRDHCVRVDTCDYSVDPAAIGHEFTALTDNEQVVALTPGGEIVDRHARCWARHQTLT